MNLLEKSVQFVENFMGQKLPVQAVNLLFAEAVTPNFVGTNYGSSIAISPEHEKNPDHLQGSLTHEVAHYYWRGQQNWMDEGMSNLIEWYQQYRENDAPANIAYPCSYAKNLKELETLNPPKSSPAFYCNYSLGERLFLDLLFTMEDQPFIEGARKLYQIATDSDNEAGIQAVQRAFGDTERTNNWYSSQNPKANFATDSTTPTWELTEIHGAIDSAGITLTPSGQTVSSFSARNHVGHAYLRKFRYSGLALNRTQLRRLATEIRNSFLHGWKLSGEAGTI